jgi:phenylalanyl-tRNA synthetase beta chain
LILDLAGGELAAGVVDVGRRSAPRPPIVLRLAQLQRILGIDVPPERVRRILTALGNVETPPAGGRRPAEPSITVVPPSWRRDLSREIDLIEEVARIDGYDKIPEDAGVPMAASARTREDRVLEKVRQVLVAAGVDEALTLSVVERPLAGAFSPWTDAEPLRSLTPVLRGADTLRVSLVPSLLAARATNEALANADIELFEIAKIYLPQGEELPREERMLGIVSGRDHAAVKGIIQSIVGALDPALELETEATSIPLLDGQASCRLQWGGQVLGYAGQVRPEGLKQFDLRGPTTVAEVKISLLVQAANLTPRYVPQPPYPAVTRDLNLVVEEAVRWADVAATVRRHGGPDLESLEYRQTYRDPQRLGAGKKSLLLTIALRSKEGTLTSPQADAVRDRIVAACKQAHGAELRA